jgi:hypothetical protein
MSPLLWLRLQLVNNLMIEFFNQVSLENLVLVFWLQLTYTNGNTLRESVTVLSVEAFVDSTAPLARKQSAFSWKISVV